jgi:APA family basic amino acid/polyamine antiporter
MTAKRPFGFWTATALVVGGMIGSGIFMVPGLIAPYGWVGVAAWVIAIGGSLCIAYCLSKLASMMPEETGAIAITGAVLGPQVGVLVGWSYWVSVWTAVAVIATAATAYLSVFLPALATVPIAAPLMSVALIWLLTLLNLGGARLAGRFQVVTTVLKLLPLILVIAIVVYLGAKGGLVAPPMPASGLSIGGLTTPVTIALFPLVGFEAAGLIAARVQRPEVNVMRATMAGTAITGLLYIIICTGIGFAIPLAALKASPAPFALFVQTYIGNGPALAVALFAAIAAIGALNCWVLVQGEVPLGMARAGLLPRWFAKTGAQDVPVRVLIVSSIFASALVLFTASRSLSGVFEFISYLTTSTAIWFYLAICVAAIVKRQAVPAAILGVIFSLWALWGAGPEASGLSLLLTLTALPLYWLRGRFAIPQTI